MIEYIFNKEQEKEDLIGRKNIDTKRFYSATTNIALIVLCFIASFVSFWDLSITIDTAFAIGLVSVLLYVVSTTVYRTKYDGGIFNGRQTEEYKNIVDSFEKRRSLVSKSNLLYDLKDWCSSFKKKDMIMVKKDIIGPYVSYEEYVDKYQKLSNKKIKKMGFSKKMTNALIRANNVSPVYLTAEMLLNSSFSNRFWGRRNILPQSGDEKRFSDFLSNYATKFIITFLCGFIAIDIISDPNLSTFIRWIVRMIPVVLAFLTGESAGFRNATEIDSKRLYAQTRMLDLFFYETGRKDFIKNEKTEEALNADNS